MYAKGAGNQVNLEADIIQNDLGRIFFKLEELQHKLIEKQLNPQEQVIQLSEKEKEVALRFLNDPHLIKRILADFDTCGLVGEEVNKLVGYIAAVSRKLLDPLPLAIIIQSMSAAGKTALMEAILAFMPKEEMVKYSAMTGKCLFYMEKTNLRNKILGIVEEEGAEKAFYPLKLLSSEGELTIASTGKDPKTGKMGSEDYHVQGPVMVVLTTTAIEIDEELLNRCLILTVDESREQTRAIHARQRNAQTLGGLKAKEQAEQIKKIHQNSQRLLKPVRVVNPYANRLTFRDDQTRMRRDNMKYLTLIASITLLHQYQRDHRFIKQPNGESIEYVITTLDDIKIANKLAHQILGRTLDELPPQTRKLANIIDEMVKKVCEQQKIERKDYRFSRRDVREYCRWGNTQLKIHMHRLEEFEYLLVHRGLRGQNYLYESLYSCEEQSGNPAFMGLIDVETLKKGHVRPEVVGV